jgi:hypothetical protein
MFHLNIAFVTRTCVHTCCTMRGQADKRGRRRQVHHAVKLVVKHTDSILEGKEKNES